MNTDYGFLPPLTKKDLKVLQKEFDQKLKTLRISRLDFQSLSVEDQEIITASLHRTFYLSKRMAKKKFTPKKYRYWEMECKK